jgi:hypothetical protein
MAFARRPMAWGPGLRPPGPLAPWLQARGPAAGRMVEEGMDLDTDAGGL